MENKGFPFAPTLLVASPASSSKKGKGKRKFNKIVVDGDSRPKRSSISAHSRAADEQSGSSSNSAPTEGSTAPWIAPLDSVAPADEIMDGTMSVIVGSEGSRALLLVLSQTCTRYVSGFCKLTLLRGSASIHGFALPMGQCIDRVFFPSWLPSARMHATGRSRKNDQSGATGAGAVIEILRKLGKTSLFPGLREEASPAGQCCSIGANMLDASECVVLVEGYARDALPWLAAAEPPCYHSPSPSMSSSSVLDHLADKPSTCGMPVSALELLDDKSCTSVGSAVVGEQSAMAHLGYSCTRLPPSWISAADRLLALSKSWQKERPVCRSPRFLVCGPKGVGKSTCLRYAINRLLAKNKVVCVLDTDVGQPEYSMPGTVSLTMVTTPNLSPPHLHLQQPVCQLFFGDVTSKAALERLRTCIVQLLQCYASLRDKLAAGDLSVLEKASDIWKSEAPAANVAGEAKPVNTTNVFAGLDVDECDTNDGIPLPLMVNTDGFVRYMGSEILQNTIQMVEPDLVLQLASEKDNTLSALQGLPRDKVCVLECGSSQASSVASLDLRNLRMAAYFLGHPYSSGEESKSLNSAALHSEVYIRNGALVDKSGLACRTMCSQAFFFVPFKSVSIGCLSDGVPPHLLPAAINASVVGVCVSSEKTQRMVTLSDASKRNITIKREVSNNDGQLGVFPCIGLAIVRSIDVATGHYHILCPDVVYEAMKQASQNGDLPISLIRGHMALPSFFLFSPSMPSHPYMTNDSAGDGSLQTKARTNLKRRVYQAEA